MSRTSTASFFLLLSGLALPACSSSTSSNNQQPAQDAGTDVVDSSLAPPDAGNPSDDSRAVPDSPAQGDSATMPDSGAQGDENEAASDAANGDEDVAASPVVLSAASTNVTAEGTDTLTVTLNGVTATSVEIDEGTTVIATLTAAPYTHDLSYSFFENGTHTYTAKVTAAEGETLTSAPLTVTVAIPANGFFVDPTNGSDDTGVTGQQGMPFKTIAKAASSLTADGQSIYLAPGSYDSSNQKTMSATFAHATNVRALGAGVVLNATAPTTNMFTFQNGGEIRNIALKGFSGGVVVTGGTFRATGCSFDTVATPYDFRGTSVGTVDETGIATPVTSSKGGGLATFISTEEGANATVQGGGATISGTPAVYVSPIFVRGHSTLVVNDLTISGVPQHAATLNDNGHLTLNDVSIQGSGFSTSAGADASVIAMGGQNTEKPATTSLTINGGGITGSTTSAIVLSLYANTGADPSITLANTHIDSNAGIGLWIASSNTGTTTATVTATNTTFDGNQRAAIYAGVGQITLTGGSVSKTTGSKGDGIQFYDATSTNTLKVRGTTFAQNAGDAIDFVGTTSSMLDLGTTADPGNLTFTQVAANFAAVHLETAIAAQAVGNTWIANTQGADDTGKYTAPTTLTSSTAAGANVNLVSGASLVVE